MELLLKDFIFLGVLGALLIWVLILQISYSKSLKLRKDFVEQFQGKDLFALLNQYIDKTKDLEDNVKKIEKATLDARSLADLGLHKVGMVRYNPFSDTGGDQSFAVAFLDSQNNGVVISSIHSREGTRIYAKTIEKGNSKHHLTDEEKEVIKKAIGSVSG